MARILVTGASGFIGSALAAALREDGCAVRGACRSAPAHADDVLIGDLGPGADWGAALNGIGAVVHLAGPAHANHDDAYLHRAMVGGSAGLAAQAEAAGIKRLVFVSSIKAVAAHAPGRALTERDTPSPMDAYGRAKLAAESAVLAQTALAPVVLRPPLVFAPDARANFAKLLRLADTAMPLPFAGFENRRSLISLASLVAAIASVLRTPSGAAGVFHVADAPALSTPAIIDALRRGLGRPLRQFSAPGISMLAPRSMTESLEIDASAFRAAYPWRGDADASAALSACAAAWKARR